MGDLRETRLLRARPVTYCNTYRNRLKSISRGERQIALAMAFALTRVHRLRWASEEKKKNEKECDFKQFLPTSCLLER